MTMKFKTTSTLNIFRAGDELIFTDHRILCCRFSRNYNQIEAHLSLGEYENDDISEEYTELGVLKIENAVFNSDHISNLIHIKLGGEIVTVKSNDYCSNDKYLAFAVDRLFGNAKFQYQTTDEELAFIKRVIGENRSNIFYRVLDLNKLCAELETYIQEKLTKPFE